MQKKRLFHWLEEAILILLVFLNISDFAEVLPADLDYVKKIISWSALGYLFYKASLTNIFFNNKDKFVDIALIISYFMLIVKNILLFSSGVMEEFVFFRNFQESLWKNAASIEIYSLIIGSISILLIALYSTKIDVRKPSLMRIIHEEGRPCTISKFIARFIIIYLVYIAFFVIVFNLVMEWLAIAIDAPLVMLGILFYLFIIIRHYERYDLEHFIYKIGKFGEKFYEKFISLFHYKRTIMLGVSGMLVLHLITDALSFILPYIFSIKDSLYFSHLGQNHTALFSLFMEQSVNLSILNKSSLFFIYILNVIGILFLLTLPAILWYSAFKRKELFFKKITLPLVLTSITMLILTPIFSLIRLKNKPILGVDIQTSLAKNIFFDSFAHAILFGLLLFISIYLLQNYFKKIILNMVIAKGMLFFAFYIYLFFTSLIIYYIETTRALFITSKYFMAFYFVIIFAINILFYIGGFIMFIDELIKEKVYKKIS